MKKHELAKILLQQEDGEVEASIDISIEGKEETYGDRAFGELIEWQEAPDNKITLIFEGYLNND